MLLSHFHSHYTGTTKAMSAPSKPIQTTAAMNIYEDTDDDDLSDISERSHEEDISEPSANKNARSIIAESTDDNRDKLYSESARTPITGLFTPEPSPEYTDRNPYFDNQNAGKRELTSTDSDADQQPFVSPTAGRSIVQARRLEQSDSEDTTSATDSQLAKQSATETFYSPDESVDDGNDLEEQQANSWRQREQNDVNQMQSSNQQQSQNDTDEDEDNSSDETNSVESQKTPVPVGKTALGEADIYFARFCTV